jgi:hypothetical protein
MKRQNLVGKAPARRGTGRGGELSAGFIVNQNE